MGIELCGVGGYNQVGKNMTAINVDGDVVLLDMGLYLEEYIKYQVILLCFLLGMSRTLIRSSNRK